MAKAPPANAKLNNHRYPPEKPATDIALKQGIARLQAELCKLQDWVVHQKLRVVIIFEGRDGAGKGGMIRTITERVSPRVFRVVALPAPTERERTQVYIQRYLPHLPAEGEVVIFDRSWYNRAGVEYVMGFCTKEQHSRFLKLTPQIEKQLVDDGIILIKYWLEVSPEEQARRFAARLTDRRRQWKLSALDLPSRAKWFDIDGPRHHARGDRPQAHAVVHRRVRRQDAGAHQLHPSPVEPDSLQAGAAAEADDAAAVAQERLRRSGDAQRPPLRPGDVIA